MRWVRKAGEASVSAWKKARESRGAREAKPEVSDAMRRSLEEGPAIDVKGEAKDGGAAAAAEAARKAREAADQASKPADGPEETTSRLLRAKRRATGDDAPKGGDGG